MILRRIDELGRVMIPGEIREKLRLTPKTQVSVKESNGKIIIEAAGNVCKLCGASAVSLSEFGICEDCTENIKRS